VSDLRNELYAIIAAEPRKFLEVCQKCLKGPVLRALKRLIISVIDQPAVIKKILQHLGLWEESHAPPDRGHAEKEIVFDPSYSQITILRPGLRLT